MGVLSTSRLRSPPGGKFTPSSSMRWEMASNYKGLWTNWLSHQSHKLNDSGSFPDGPPNYTKSLRKTMNNNEILHELETIQTKISNLREVTNLLIKSYLDLNLETPWEDVVRNVAKFSKIHAIKLVYDYMGGTLKSSKYYVDSLCK